MDTMFARYIDKICFIYFSDRVIYDAFQNLIICITNDVEYHVYIDGSFVASLRNASYEDILMIDDVIKLRHLTPENRNPLPYYSRKVHGPYLAYQQNGTFILINETK